LPCTRKHQKIPITQCTRPSGVKTNSELVILLYTVKQPLTQLLIGLLCFFGLFLKRNGEFLALLNWKLCELLFIIPEEEEQKVKVFYCQTSKRCSIERAAISDILDLDSFTHFKMSLFMIRADEFNYSYIRAYEHRRF